MPDFEIKDLDQNVESRSGARRSDPTGKIDYTLALDGPMFERYAVHMTKAAVTRGDRNWMKANSQEDLDRFRTGFFRHVIQYLMGWEDEDHAAAIIFGLNGMEHVKAKMDAAEGPSFTQSLLRDASQIAAAEAKHDEAMVPFQGEFGAEIVFDEIGDEDDITTTHIGEVLG